MSEETANGVNSSSPEQQMIPKQRLDELIAERRRLEEQLSTAQYLLREQSTRSVPVVPEKEPESLQRLREENPDMYQHLKQQELKLKQQSAATFGLMDNQDRLEFVRQFGDDGEKRLHEVEAKLEELRAKNIHHYNRGQIFLHLEGLDNFENKRKSKVAPAQEAQQSVPAHQAQADGMAPSSRPSAAGVVKSGSAAATSASRPTIEELEERLGDTLL